MIDPLGHLPEDTKMRYTVVFSFRRDAIYAEAHEKCFPS
jgi:hypothetical protein